MAKNKPLAVANGLFCAICITFLSYYFCSAAFLFRRALISILVASDLLYLKEIDKSSRYVLVNNMI